MLSTLQGPADLTIFLPEVLDGDIVLEGILVTEDEWLYCESPIRMLGFVITGSRLSDKVPAGTPWIPPFVDPRKLRLFCCACNTVFHHRCWTEDHIGRLIHGGYEKVEESDGISDQWSRGYMVPAQEWCRRPGSARGFNDCQTYAHTADILREILGNPYWIPEGTTVTACPGCRGESPATDDVCNHCQGRGAIVSRPAWADAETIVMARTIHKERSWEDMPILADFLEDKGCHDEEVLAHCRAPSIVLQRCKCGLNLFMGKYPLNKFCANQEKCGGVEKVAIQAHFRGCWVLDYLMGKDVTLGRILGL